MALLRHRRDGLIDMHATVQSPAPANGRALRSMSRQVASGRQGWWQRGNFVVTGMLWCAAARGLQQAPRVVGPQVVPILVATAGAGLVGSGLFVTDSRIPGGPASFDLVLIRVGLGETGLQVTDDGTDLARSEESGSKWA